MGLNEVHLTESGIVQAVEPADFAGGDVAAPLRHHADAPLRIGRLERVDVVDERWLRRYLKVPENIFFLN